MANRLKDETSPYLLQHADNPVDWYPWGEEALSTAREQDKPILLSIGYSSCHWCHVMAHESFENPDLAAIMNQNFINIKVDREERPDLDAVYMAAVQMLSGQGGWPMTVFLTPDMRPFYAGTYFPPEDRPPMPGFARILDLVADAYRDRREDIDETAEQISAELNHHFQAAIEGLAISPSILDDGARKLALQFDQSNGGFGNEPKFPPSMSLEFLLRTYVRTGSKRALEMVTRTLDRMARGGIYDQIGGGFHRYSVDAIWLVPHFEKMLYDNALLARIYTLGYQAAGKDLYRRIAEQTFTYVLREMTSPEGGFYSAQDADSEGKEGKFYIWSAQDFETVLGRRDASIAKRYFGIMPDGNFEGKNILTAPREPERVADQFGISLDELERTIAEIRGKLYQARSTRVWPGRDDKVLTAWNALMLRSFAEGATVFGRADLLEVAVRNARFIRDNLYQDGRLLRTYTAGQAKLNGYLEDYAYLIDALLSLYEATFDASWIAWAQELTDTMVNEFWDPENGGFFSTGTSHEELVARPKELFDSATPSGNSVAADVLLRLSHLLGRNDYRERGMAVLEKHGMLAKEYPHGAARLLLAYDFALSSPREIALVGDPSEEATRSLLAVVQQPYLPHKVVALRHPGLTDEATIIPLLEGRDEIEGNPAAYVCRNFTCERPVTEPAELAAQLGVEIP